MCGIAGAINGNNVNIEEVKKALFHRGPNEQTHYEYHNLCLIHARLSIQDIKSGHQPFCSSDNNYVIIFNGEIYNHLDLRNDLVEFSFRTLSDTETLLNLYIKYGEEMFEKLDGMFAFAILDKKNNQLILARDRAGKKPLYLYKNNQTLAFGSELNTLKTLQKDLKMNEEAIEAYLRCGFFYAQHTAYENVENLDAGTVYKIDLGTLEISKKRYFNIKNYYLNKVDLDFETALQKTDELLHLSVKDRLLSSDLEVGAFLSGGIDSSLVVAIASEYKSNLRTFTVKFDGTYDESHLARLTANKYKTNHTELTISMNLKNDIEKILFNYGQPFMDSSAVPSYYVSQEAKKHVTVILNGDGADELFGGYRRYVPAANGLLNSAKLFSWLRSFMPKAHNKQSVYNYVYRLLSMAQKEGLDFYLSATVDIFEDEYQFKTNKIFEQMNLFIKQSQLDSLSKMLYLDFNLLLFSDLLIKMDIATMAHSLEGRSPFLSKYMLEFVPTLKNEYKIKGRSTKHILRELSKKYLPKELITQPKRGFEVPLKKWVENDLKENIFDSLKTNSYSSQFISQQFINDLLSCKINVSHEKRAKMLWTMYCLEVWKKNQ
jgi:asparagine synthase (glutamine-hydrolysing)